MTGISADVQSKVDTLQELFPDWSASDLIELVQEYKDLETVIDKITSGVATRWDEVKRPSRKERKEHAAQLQKSQQAQFLSHVYEEPLYKKTIVQQRHKP